MIDLNELKPILEPLLGDESADIIDQITALDTHSTESDVEEAIAKVNADWQQRYKAAFFHGDGVPVSSPAPVVEPEPEPAAEVPSLDDLIYPNGK